MGIKNLLKLLESEAPDSVREINSKTYTSEVIALDASIWLYQFFVQVRTFGEDSFSTNLRNEKGEVTSHLMGFLNRTVTLLERGIRPLYVFDGKPPDMKRGELRRRRELKDKAIRDANDARERLEGATGADRAEAIEEIDKLSKRSVFVTRDHVEETKRLLTLMGVPYVQAPCEAEAQCAELVKGGKAVAVGSEDMDTLAFSAPILLKRLTDSKRNTQEVVYSRVLEDLGLSEDEFLDMCILCGCDYCRTLPGVGAKTALKLIRKHKTIEEVVRNMKNPPDEGYLEEVNIARGLFRRPEVIPYTDVKFNYTSVDESGLTEFLVSEKGFGPERVKRVIERIRAVKKRGVQTRLTRYFN